MRRPVEQLLEFGIDFGMVAKSEGNPRLLGAGAAVAADYVKYCPFHFVRLPREASGRIRRPRDSGVIPDRETA